MKGPLVLKALAGQKTQTRRLKFKGAVGSRVWIKETFTVLHDGEVVYRAGEGRAICDLKWKPSIYMPKKLSRLWLEVTGLRTEPLQSITEEDALAEGVEGHKPAEGDQNGLTNCARYNFARLWDEINYAKCPWAMNPSVFVVTFKRIDAPMEV